VSHAVVCAPVGFDIFFASYAEEFANGELAERISILLTDAVPKSLLAQRPVISL
jgi:hypothetical protein